MIISRKFANYIKHLRENNKHIGIIYGGRRSGKTYNILQYLLLMAYNKKLRILIAGMTLPQLKNGAFLDAINIIDKDFSNVFEYNTNPMKITNKINGSSLIFMSFENPEKCKGYSCDLCYINEANIFSKDIFTSIRVNVRDLILIDFNPVKKFWINELYESEEWLKLNYKDNPFLSESQLDYFRELKYNAEKPNASSLDIYLWKVNGEGEFCGLSGNIFTRENIQITNSIPQLHNILIFCDPSALRGSDYFACSLGGLDSEKNLYILDTYSINTGATDNIISKLYDWSKNYDVKRIYIETNGIIGTAFYEDVQKNNRDLKIMPWYSRDNKFQRIVANYNNITKKIFFYETGNNLAFLDQVYEFSEKCEHDDNIDSINSLWAAQNFK